MLNKLFVSTLIVILLCCNLNSEEKIKLIDGIPYGILKQVFIIKYENNNKYGTCFVIDVDNKQYIITAKHIIGEISDNEKIKIYSEINGAKWQNFKVKPIYHDDEDIDIIALATDSLITPKVSFEVSGGSIGLGQDVFFLGFPYAFDKNIGEKILRNFPFVKKGIFSLVTQTNNGNPIFFIDAHNNQGFSGGPVIFSTTNNNLSILAVISGFISKPRPIYRIKTETNSKTEESKPNFYVIENSGILIAYSIQPIIDAIKKNPIGFPIK